MKKVFYIITIHKGKLSKLNKTLESLPKQKKNLKVLIISPDYFLKNKINKFTSRLNCQFILGRDNSIYHAMNLGLKFILNKNFEAYVLFLNSGDCFLNSNSFDFIKKKIFLKRNYIFKTIQTFENIIYFPKKIFFLSNIYKPHQGFVAYINRNIKNKFRLDLLFSADGFWIENQIKKFKQIKINKIISICSLGGISNSPSILSCKSQFKLGFFKFIKEFLKLILYKTLPKKKYYNLIYYNKYNKIKL